MDAIDGLHVWRVGLRSEPSVADRLREYLSRRETERAARFREELHRQRYIVAHGALREILAGYLGTSPAGIVFQYSPEGKPSIEHSGSGPSLFFNLSHSDDLCVVAVARHREIGIDIERAREARDLDDVADRFFSEDERGQLREMPHGERASAFFRGWTAKEAYAKAVGSGLKCPFAAVEVELRESQPARFARIEGRTDTAGRWTLIRPHLASGYVAAIAIEGPADEPSVFDWDPSQT